MIVTVGFEIDTKEGRIAFKPGDKVPEPMIEEYQLDQKGLINSPDLGDFNEA